MKRQEMERRERDKNKCEDALHIYLKTGLQE
jgi:hypothetical protein